MCLALGAMTVGCDEHECPTALLIESLDGGTVGFRTAAAMARAHGWRAYADARRRDLCPKHRTQARKRLTLIG